MIQNLTKLSYPLKALLPDAVLALCMKTSVKKGALLFQAGKKPVWMFFVLNGEVTLERLSQQGDPVVLQRTRHGFVSEASLQSSKYLFITKIKPTLHPANHRLVHWNKARNLECLKIFERK